MTLRRRIGLGSFLFICSTFLACRVPSVPHHVFLVTLDTLRADHLSSYGYLRPTSPFLDGLADRGALFVCAYAPMPTTVPSHASLFTSLYPIQHKVLKNGHVLDASITTLAETLAGSGYTTAGFVSTSKHFGPANLNQGFATFDQPRLRPGERYRIGRETLSQAIEWLDRQDFSKPLFLWVHLFDAHDPYRREHRWKLETQSERDAMLELLLNERQVDLGVFGGSPDRLLETIEATTVRSELSTGRSGVSSNTSKGEPAIRLFGS